MHSGAALNTRGSCAEKYAEKPVGTLNLSWKVIPQPRGGQSWKEKWGWISVHQRSQPSHWKRLISNRFALPSFSRGRSCDRPSVPWIGLGAILTRTITRRTAQLKTVRRNGTVQGAIFFWHGNAKN